MPLKTANIVAFMRCGKSRDCSGTLAAEKPTDSNNRRSHDEARSIRTSRSSLFSENRDRKVCLLFLIQANRLCQ